MAESFSRWESDPLFSAAEVVQDSADRMESVYRMLLHEQSVSQGDPSDAKLQTLMQYHRRDLVTTLETTKWQLEDFERAVNFAALSDKSNSRKHALSRHREFIRAIFAQILQVEKSVKESWLTDSNRNMQPVNLNEQEMDGLAFFLSGGDSKYKQVHYDTETSIMRRFLDSTTESDEIVELKTEELEPLPLSGLKHSEYGNDSSKNYTPWKDGSHDLEAGGTGASCYSYKRTLRGSIWRFLRNFWISNKIKGNFTKRWKDGEVMDELVADTEQRIPSSTFNIAPSEQDHFWMHWISDSRICGVSNIQGSLSAVQFHHWIEVLLRRFQRSQYLFLYKRFPLRLASALLVILIILCLVAFYRA